MSNKKALLLKNSVVCTAVLSALSSMPLYAAENEAQAKENNIERIMVTSRRKSESVIEIPMNVSTVGAIEIADRNLLGKEDLFRTIAGAASPRGELVLRGLSGGNESGGTTTSEIGTTTTFTDGVPYDFSDLYDVERVEVLRGPQGTLFGRNTPAGIVKVQSKKPTQDFDATVSGSYGSFGSTDFRLAVGGGLTDTLSARFSLLQQDRDDWIDNKAPGFEQKDQLGGYGETAARLQLLWEPNDDFSALFNYHFRDAEADARIFRANIIKPGTNDLVDDFDRETVFHDAAVRNNQTVDMKGASLKIEYDFGSHTLTSITGHESAEMFSVGDIDGGYGAAFLPDYMGPGFIPFPSETGAKMPDHKQSTQEIRIASNDLGDFDYQFGFFLFDEDLTINNLSFDTLANGAPNGLAIQNMETTAWAVFASLDYQISDKLSINGGLRYSDDERKWDGELVQSPFGAPGFTESNDVEDSQVSGDFSASYVLNDETNIYARIARGYRAPSIQGRSLLFSANSTTADSETVDSIETGFKSVFLENTARVDGSVYYYVVKDQQLTAVGGTGNVASLLNADKSVGYGFELDSEYFVTPDLVIAGSVSYNHTELKDSTVAVPGCGSGCTVTDPLNADGLAIIDGNSLPQSPEWISNISARWTKEIADGELYFYTDWSYRSEVNFFLYESTEFKGDALLEGGVRVGYEWFGDDAEYEVALFGRNITDEEQLTGAIDFNNLTGYVNEPRFWGVEFKANFF